MAAALPPRDVFPIEVKREFKTQIDFDLDPGTGAGQVLYWDAGNNKWIPSETPPASDEIVFWDNSATAVKYLTIGSGLTITDTTLTSSLFTHAILSTGHTDATTDTVTRGSLIYGNSTPKWDELTVSTALGATATDFLATDGTDAGYRTLAQVLADLSGDAGAAFSWNSQNLTSLGNMTGTDIDISAGTGDYTSSGDVTLSGTGKVTAGTAGFVVGTLTITDGSIIDTSGELLLKVTSEENIVVQLGDSDAGTELSINDSNGVNVVSMDSDGNANFTGDMGIEPTGSFTVGTLVITESNIFDVVPINIKSSSDQDDFLVLSTVANVVQIGVDDDNNLLQLVANALTVNGTINSGAITSSGASTFNSGSVDADFTVNWNTGTGLFVQGSSGAVGIGTTSPDKSLEIRNSSPVIRLRDTGATANATTAFIEFGGTDAGVWNRTGYIGDGQSGNTDIILQAEDSDLILGDSSGFNILTLSGGDATFTGSINIGASGKINFRDTDISIGSTLTDGILDLNADFSIDMFFDNADVGAEVDGQSLNINRRAVEGDDYISLYVDKDKKGLIGFSGDNDLLVLAANTLTVNGTLRLVQKAGTAVDGDLWNDSTQEALQTFVSGIELTLVGVIFTQTADQTIADDANEITLFGSGVGTLTLPANFWTVGKTIRIEIHGDFADTGNPTADIHVFYGATKLSDSSPITLSGLSATEGWETRVLITCRSTGATGTVETHIDWEYETTTGSSLIERLDVAGTITTIDTTASGALDITFTWGTAAAANTITSKIAFVEILN